MTSSQLIGLNTKWYRYQKKLTQEVFAEKLNIKISYLSYIENGSANLTCKKIDKIVNTFKIQTKDLFNEETAKLAKKLPPRVDMYKNFN